MPTLNALESCQHDGDEHTEVIAQGPRLTKLLQHLKDTRSVLTIRLQDQDTPFTSAVIDLDPNQGHIILDELLPVEGQRLLRPGTSLNVSTRVRGVFIHFNTELAHTEQTDGVAANAAHLPNPIFYEQKRSHYRVHISLCQQVPIMLEEVDNGPYTGRLINLSVGGLCAAFDPGVKINAGDILPHCAIELAGESLSCALEIRFAALDGRHKALRVGGSFVNLTPAQERIIQHAVNIFEREQLRKAPVSNQLV